MEMDTDDQPSLGNDTSGNAQFAHSTLSKTHAPAHEYTYRVPTPPRITVPPPTLNTQELPDFHLQVDASKSFLASIPHDNLVHSNAMLQWTYEQRREAQRVLPYLYLGPLVAAKNPTFLTREQITFILCIRQKHAFESKLMHSALRTANDLGIAHATIDLADNQELIAAFPRATAQITAHMHTVHKKYAAHQQYSGLSEQAAEPPSMGRVLVFCESGNERAAGVVAAFLMEAYDSVDYVKAMQLVQAQRFCVNFDDGMKRLLQGYWDILQARKMCARDQSGSGGMKRELERDEEMGDDDAAVQGSADDQERFGGRASGPFVDA